MAISRNGRYVVGYFNPGGAGFDRGFWFDMNAQQFHILPFPGDGYQSSYCNDVNDAGLLVGSLWHTVDPAVQRGFLFDVNTGQFITQILPLPGAAYAEATGINNSGQVCGTRSIGSKGDPTWPTTAFAWTQDGGIIDLGVMNGPSSHALGIIEDGSIFGYTGHGEITSGTNGFTWRSGIATIVPAVPEGTSSAVRAVLDSSHLVLSGRTTVNGSVRTRGFAAYGPVVANLGVMPGLMHTFAWAVDKQGQIFGGCNDSNGNTYAFSWRDGRLTPFQNLVLSTGVFLSEAHDVSLAGMVVGQGIDTHGDVVGLAFTPLANRKGDTNCDATVNVQDLLNVINRWGPCDACSSDLDADLDVDVFDLLTVLSNWG